jgi:hypothetical protein
VSAAIRLNWTFSPTLSLQLYAQPLISSGGYTRFKTLARPRAFAFDVYGEGGSTITDNDSVYVLDADGAGAAAAVDTLENPDFSVHSLRGNAVLRWEYLPGSTMFFVWTQSRSGDENVGDFRFRHSMGRMLETAPDNIFMVKVTYWWNP